LQVQASPRKLYVSSSSAACAWKRHEECGGRFGQKLLWLGCERALSEETSNVRICQTKFCYQPQGGLSACAPVNGWSHIIVPGKMYIMHIILCILQELLSIIINDIIKDKSE